VTSPGPGTEVVVPALTWERGIGPHFSLQISLFFTPELARALRGNIAQDKKCKTCWERENMQVTEIGGQ
jgi:hypothetical protein